MAPESDPSTPDPASRDPSTSNPASREPSGQDPSTRDLVTDPRLLTIVAASSVGVFGNQSVPPVLPSIGAAFALTDTQIGLVMTVYFLAALVMAPVYGVAADVYGRRPVVLSALVAFGVGGLVGFLAPSYPVLLGARVIQGAGLAGLTPLSVALLGDFFEGARGTAAQGIRSSANGLMLIVSPILAGAIAVLGWQYPFLLYGAAFPVFLLVYWYLPEGAPAGDGVHEGPFETADEAAEHDVRDDGGPAIREEIRTYVSAMTDVLDDRNMAVLVLGGVTLFFIRVGLLTIVPLLATRTLGAGPAMVGLVLSVLGAIRVLVSPFSGHLVARLSRKRSFVVTMLFVVASTALLTVVPSLMWLGVALATFAVGMALFNPLLNDSVTAAATPDTRAGVVMAMQMGKNLANTTAPAAFTLALTLSDFPTVFVLATAVSLGYVVLIATVLDPSAF